MSYEEKKAQLEGWLGGLRLWGLDGERFRFAEHEGGRGTVVFCSDAHGYHLSFAENYLGCTASCRTQRPGETWTRGSDLPDGKFNQETFDKIIFAVVGYELVELAPVHEPVADVPVAV